MRFWFGMNVFFFSSRRRHTRFKCDWSSDVCSSDLCGAATLTGYVPPQSVAAPHLGAFIAKALGPRDPAMPPFINIGQRFDLGEGEELKAFTTAGFLGSEFGPFNIPFPPEAATAVRPPAGLAPGRFEDRTTVYKRLLADSPVEE